MTTPCNIKCCICAQPMDWRHRYGREAACCSKDCYREFEWRNTLSILGKPYTIDPQLVAWAEKRAAELGLPE
jgi:hypothetical protein